MAVKNLVSPFNGQEINALPIPGRWLRGIVLPDEPTDAVGGQLRIGSEDYTYDRVTQDKASFSGAFRGGSDSICGHSSASMRRSLSIVQSRFSGCMVLMRMAR